MRPETDVAPIPAIKLKPSLAFRTCNSHNRPTANLRTPHKVAIRVTSVLRTCRALYVNKSAQADFETMYQVSRKHMGYHSHIADLRQLAGRSRNSAKASQALLPRSRQTPETGDWEIKMLHTVHDAPGFKLDIRVTLDPYAGATVEFFSTWLSVPYVSWLLERSWDCV
jgi:hypothetical protein